MSEVIEFSEGVDALGTETAHVAVVDGNLYAAHTSFRRGGCLYAGTVVLRNFSPHAPVGAKEIDVTSRASDSEAHVRYLLGLAERHVGGVR
jgi:hypothetical protein